MPHIFKVMCYDKQIRDSKAKVGDTVYLKSRTDLPMTVHNLPRCNTAAGHARQAGVVYINTDGRVIEQIFDAILLTL